MKSGDIKKQLQGVKPYFAWAVSFTGLVLLTVTVFRGTSFIIHGKTVPWTVVVVNFLIGLVLLGSGCLMDNKSVSYREFFIRLGSWVEGGLPIIGILFLVRFLSVLLDGLGGAKPIHWPLEISLASAGAGMIILWSMRMRRPK